MDENKSSEIKREDIVELTDEELGNVTGGSHTFSVYGHTYTIGDGSYERELAKINEYYDNWMKSTGKLGASRGEVSAKIAKSWHYLAVKELDKLFSHDE